MPSFAEIYRRTFASLGYELLEEDACPETEIVAAESRLGVRIPQALRDFYLVAGREKQFNQLLDCFLMPSKWTLEDDYLPFIESHQAVTLWGIRVSEVEEPDPPVYQGANNDVVTWYPEADKCSLFLSVWLHWQGAYTGAMPFARVATVPMTLREKLDAEWAFVGEVNDMRAYHRAYQAACFLKWDADWKIFAGATTEALMQNIARDLAVQWDYT